MALCHIWNFGNSAVGQVDGATHMQHNRDMKTAILPQVRVAPELREDLESVLREGETLSEFVEASVRSAVEHRRVQIEFHLRADAAWAHFQQTGEAYPAQEVVAELRAKVDARRRHLQGKHRPAAE